MDPESGALAERHFILAPRKVEKQPQVVISKSDGAPRSGRTGKGTGSAALGPNFLTGLEVRFKLALHPFVVALLTLVRKRSSNFERKGIAPPEKKKQWTSLFGRR